MPSIEDTDKQKLLELLNAAEAFAKRGDMFQAQNAFNKVLEIDPLQPRALNSIAMNLAAKRDYKGAIMLLNKALLSDNKLAIIDANLGMLHHDLKEYDLALIHLNAALVKDPNAYSVHFEKASVYEEMGREKAASLAYQQALISVPESIRNHPAVESKVQYAISFVSKTNDLLGDYLAEQLKGLGSYPLSELKRFAECKDIMLGRKKAYVQKPVMMNFPELPSICFYDTRQFDWVEEFEAAFEGVSSDLQKVLSEDDQNFVPYVKSEPGSKPDIFQALDNSLNWGAYFLYNQGVKLVNHCEKCPNTMNALGRFQRVQIKDRAPTIFFSSLMPGIHIPPHNGATNTRLTVHMPLIIPSDCGIRVGNEVRQWESGKLLIFNDTIEHEAWNYSSQRRVVLIFDIWNPALSEIEKQMVRTLTEGIVSFYEGSQDLGEL